MNEEDVSRPRTMPVSRFTHGMSTGNYAGRRMVSWASGTRWTLAYFLALLDA
jgi:hypothetical protein